jgi:hypothetical protein
VIRGKASFQHPKDIGIAPSQHTWSGTQAIIGDEEVKLQWGNGRFTKTIKISRETYIPIMPSSARVHTI